MSTSTPARWGLPLVVTFLAALFLIPSDGVIKAVGAMGFPAALVAYVLLTVWIARALLGLGRPGLLRYPVRGVVAIYSVTNLVGYAVAQTLPMSETVQLSADRYLMLNAACAGVVLVVAEGCVDRRAVRLVITMLLAGACLSSLVAVADVAGHLGLNTALKTILPGLTRNANYALFQDRGGLTRVPGTALHPLEFGAVACVVAPLGLATALLREGVARVGALVATGLILLALPLSVSRSAFLGIGLALCVFVPLHPPRQRLALLTGAVAVPIAAFLLAPAFLATFIDFTENSSRDDSIVHRLSDYELVARKLMEHPIFGTGGGTYTWKNPIDILDNAYLTMLTEFGLLGSVGILVFLVGPLVLAILLRRRARSTETREYAAALVASFAASLLMGATFDTYSFPQYLLTYCVLVGLLGALWLGNGLAPRSVAEEDGIGAATADNIYETRQPEWSR